MTTHPDLQHPDYDDLPVARKQVPLILAMDEYRLVLEYLNTLLAAAPPQRFIADARRRAARNARLSPDERAFMVRLRSQVPSTQSVRGEVSLRDVERYSIDRTEHRRKECARINMICDKLEKQEVDRKPSIQSALRSLVKYALENIPRPEKVVDLGDLDVRVPPPNCELDGRPFETEHARLLRVAGNP